VKARDYYLAIQAAIHAAPHVLRSEIRFDEVDAAQCYIRGTLELLSGLELHIAEYVITEPTLQRPKYRYHLQTADDKIMISRWDNVAHHPQIETFPHHRHDHEGKIHPSQPMDITILLDTVLGFIPS
jgi:hypothetical protein